MSFWPKRIPSAKRVPRLVIDQIYLLIGRLEDGGICYLTTKDEELAQKLVYPDQVLGEWSRCTTYYPDLNMAQRILDDDDDVSLDGTVYRISGDELEKVTAAQWCVVLEFPTKQ